MSLNHDVSAPNGAIGRPAAEVTLESALSTAVVRRSPEPQAVDEPAARWRRPDGVRAGLTFMLAISLLPALVGAGLYLRHLRDLATGEAFAQVDLLSRTTAESLNWLLQDAQATMEAIAVRPKVKALDTGDCDSIFRDFHDVSPAFKAIALRRADGGSICSELAQPPDGATVAAAPWFQAAVKQSGFRASDVHIGVVQHAWTVRLTYPVAGPSGRPEALLISPVDLDALARRLFGHLPAPAVVAVVDGGNRVVVRSERQLERVGKLAAQSVVPDLDEVRKVSTPALGGPGASRQFFDTGINGERRLFALVRVPLTDWIVVASLPEEETLQNYVALRNKVAMALASVLALVALAAWRVSRGILVPIKGLARAARGVGHGDTTCRAPESGPREIREVAREFNRMVLANHEAGERLRASERHYRALIQHMPVAVMTFTVDGAVEAFNDKACTLLRMAAEEIDGTDVANPQWYFVGSDGQRLAPEAYPVSRVLKARRALPPVMLGIVSEGRKSGPPDARGASALPHTWVMVTGYPQSDETGQMARVIALFVDITAQRKTDELLVAKEAAEAASQAKSLFLSRMSHELRTPLNAINGFSELMLLDPNAPDPMKDKVRHIFDAGRHLLVLINQIMDLSRIEAGALRTNLQPLDLWPVVRECVAICGPMAQAHGLELREAASGDPRAALPVAWAMADPTHVRQILMNLLSNAIKYNRRGGRVVVGPDMGGQHGPGTVGVSVTDTGIGLSEADVRALFQPFNRLGASHGTIEGHGLGLSISRQLARAMGGDIAVHSVPAQGSTFTLWLSQANPP